MRINYHNRKFKVVSNSENGELSENQIFVYLQKGNVLTSNYSNTNILSGHILGIVNDDDSLDISYHQINVSNELKTGICHSKPEILSSGKIRINESWKWTSGDFSEGFSTLEEF